MVWQDHVTIAGEVANSEARENLVRQVSWSLAVRAEEALRKQRAELEEKIKQLRRSLDLPFLPDEVRDSVITKIKELESSPVVTVLSRSVDVIDGEHRVICCCPSEAESVLSEVIFISEYVRDEIHWRVIQVSVKMRTDFNQPVPCTKPSIALSFSCIVFDKDSLSHFQNCRVPPPTTAEICNRTQGRFVKLLTKGCFVGITQYITEPRSYKGGLEWTESRKRRMNVSESYKELLLTYPRNLKSSFAGCTTSLKNTRKSRRERYQSYSDFIAISLRAITLKHLASSFFYLFSSHSGNVINKKILRTGEIN